MKLTPKHLLRTAIVAAVFALPLRGAAAAEWEIVAEEDGIQAFRKEVPGSDVLALMGKTTIDAPISKILYVLTDAEHRHQWVDRLTESRRLEMKNKHDFVIYNAFELPVISDRDVVFRGQATRDDDGVVTVRMWSIEHPKAPPTVGVRANLMDSAYRLFPMDGGLRTRLEIEIHTTPGGWLPNWLINLLQKKWPIKTLRGIRKQVLKPFVEDYPLPPVK